MLIDTTRCGWGGMPPHYRRRAPLRAVALVALSLLASIPLAADEAETKPSEVASVSDAWAQVPQILRRIVPPTFPPRVFDVCDFGAMGDAAQDCTDAFRQAVRACHDAGGGRVLVPAGKYRTGPIHLLSNVELHLAENAEVIFSDRFEDYLPPVLVRVGGVEVYNYSPLIYANGCENIAITGDGVLNGNAQAWWAWKGHETVEHFEMAVAGTPVETRVFGTVEAAIRPSFVSFIHCQNVLLEDFEIGGGPNWTLHPVYCTNVTIRGVQIRTEGPNNDGIDPDSCRDVLIEDCVFDTRDDCVVLKSGYNEDGWRVARPTENVIVRRCKCNRGHGGLVIGSEMSGGIRNVFMEDCEFQGTQRGVRIKSRSDRGGTVENIYVRNLSLRRMQHEAIVLTMDYTSDPSRLQVPAPPRFRNMVFEQIACDGAPVAVLLRGMESSPIERLQFREVRIRATKGVRGEWVDDLLFDDVTIVPSKGPAFAFQNSGDITIRNSIAPVAADSFLQLDGIITGQVLLEDCDLRGVAKPVVRGPQVSQDAIVVQ